MSPVPVDAFAREFRDLDAADRSAFVAALWDARGWETAVENGSVLAERDGDRRRIGVVDPGRFGTPDLSGLDTLVVARDRDAVEAAASEAGVEYVPPAELRELLLYGVEREAAATLYEEYVGEPLARAAAEVPENGRSGSVLPALPEVAVSRRVLAAVVILALVSVALAGPSLPGSEPAPAPMTASEATPEDGTVDAVGVASATPTAGPDVAPGLTLDGVESARTLADAHVAGVRNRSRVLTWRLDAFPNASATRGVVSRDATARIVNGSHYRHESDSVLTSRNGTTNSSVYLYADGEAVHDRVAFGDDVDYHARSIEEAPATNLDEGVEAHLYRYFVGVEDSVVTCAIEYDTDCPTYRVAVDDPPNALGEGVEEYEALLIVSDRGVITTIRASYTLPDADGDGEREAVSFALDYRFEDVDPAEPDWVPTAKNATANGTETDDGALPWLSSAPRRTRRRRRAPPGRSRGRPRTART